MSYKKGLGGSTARILAKTGNGSNEYTRYGTDCLSVDACMEDMANAMSIAIENHVQDRIKKALSPISDTSTLTTHGDATDNTLVITHTLTAQEAGCIAQPCNREFKNGDVLYMLKDGVSALRVYNAKADEWELCTNSENQLNRLGVKDGH